MMLKHNKSNCLLKRVFFSHCEAFWPLILTHTAWLGFCMQSESVFPSLNTFYWKISINKHHIKFSFISNLSLAEHPSTFLKTPTVSLISFYKFDSTDLSSWTDYLFLKYTLYFYHNCFDNKFFEVSCSSETKLQFSLASNSNSSMI
jgi:hypothetical protein